MSCKYNVSASEHQNCASRKHIDSFKPSGIVKRWRKFQTVRTRSKSFWGAHFKKTFILQQLHIQLDAALGRCFGVAPGVLRASPPNNSLCSISECNSCLYRDTPGHCCCRYNWRFIRGGAIESLPQWLQAHCHAGVCSRVELLLFGMRSNSNFKSPT